MSADTLLDLAGIILGLTYIALVITYMAQMIWAGQDATLRQLTRIIRGAGAAVAVASVNLVVQVASIPYDGALWPLIWVVNTALACGMVVVVHRRRAAKGDRVVAEAERTVRDFNPLDGERDAGR